MRESESLSTGTGICPYHAGVAGTTASAGEQVPTRQAVHLSDQGLRLKDPAFVRQRVQGARIISSKGPSSIKEHEQPE